MGCGFCRGSSGLLGGFRVLEIGVRGVVRFRSVYGGVVRLVGVVVGR